MEKYLYSDRKILEKDYCEKSRLYKLIYTYGKEDLT